MENAVINNPCPPNFSWMIIGKIDGFPFLVPFLVEAEAAQYISSLDWAAYNRSSLIEYVVYKNGTEVGKYKSHEHSTTLN